VPAPVVSITTVLFNSASTVEPYARPLEPLLASGFAELIAVDNASPDDSASRLHQVLPDAQIETAARNLGFAAGCNVAWPHVKGRYWLLLNPDVQASTEGIRALAHWLDRHSDVAIGTPLLRDENGAPASVARSFPTLRWTFAEMLRMHKLMSATARSERMLGPYWDGGPRDVDWVPFAAAMIRRSAIERVGPLSDGLFMYGEDIELCWRMRRAGWRVTICDEVTFVHAGGLSARATWHQEERSARLAEGIAAALRLMHGRAWTRTFAAMTALHLYLESVNPRREPERRRANRLSSRAWFREATRGRA
jgi:N-acetylglucosaminyl-diphospho-decaprenol L-rhamnosyltransferase